MCSLQLPSSFSSNKIIMKNPLPSSNFANYSSKTKSSSPLLRLRLAGRQKSSGFTVTAKKDSIELPEGLEAELMPKHVAVIMDGNRRWAKNRGMSVQQGHREGGEAFKQLFRNCHKYGVQVVTVFAFSTENWIRPQGEVEFLMNLFKEVIFSELKNGLAHVRVSFIGNRGQLPESLQKLMSEAEEVTSKEKNKKKMQLVVAINYGGRYDISEATRKIAGKVRDGELQVEEIDDGVVEKHLQTDGIEFPNPDLVIRSSGEHRVSNFMLWQLAYSEFFFTDKLFPDFDEKDLIQAFTAFQRRQRRYGGHNYA